MNTQKANQTLLEKVTNEAIGFATKANDFALNTTEKAFDGSFKIAYKSLDTTHKVVKKGLEISANQQDMIFDALTAVKKQLVKN